MALIVLLKILPVLFLFLPKIASSTDFNSIVSEQTPFIIDMCKYNRPKSVIFLYAKSIEGKIIFQFLFFILIIFMFIFLRNGNDNADVQMETSTFSRRVYKHEFVLFTIARIIILFESNCTTVLYSGNLELQRD